MTTSYTIEDDILGMEGLEPTIHRKYDSNEENIFLGSLAKMHGVDVAQITITIEGCYRIYKINGVNIFRDINNAPQ